MSKILLPAFYLLIAGLASFLMQFVVGYPMLWLLGPTTFQTPLATTVRTALSYFAAILILIILPQVFHSKPPKSKLLNKLFSACHISRSDLGLSDLPTFTDIFLSFIGFFAYLLFSSFLLQIIKFFPWFDASQAQDVGFSHFLVGPDRIIAFIALVILAPIFEEIIFRGWLYYKIRQRNNPIVTTLLVSVLFGLLHGQWNVGVNVFGLSLILCASREITGTIYASILLHIIKNGIAFYLAFVIGFY